VSTVCAPASPPGRGAVSLVRVAGPGVPDLLRDRLGRLPSPRSAALVAWKDRRGKVLDQALAVYFPAPHSYTGDDVLELSLHGNPLLVREVLLDLHASGIPLAAPGEFTRRAVESGKMDLSRAESVAAVVSAETGEALEASRRILSGALRGRLEPLRSSLLELSARLELEVDFAEEEAVPGGHDLLEPLARVVAELDRLRAAQDRVEARGHAPRAALAGRPNAGKSSLANALLGEDRLLVSPVAGTTRDWVEVPVPVGTGTVVLVDTAGLGTPTDGLDSLAQDRARAAMEAAPLRLVVVEAGRELSAEESELARRPRSMVVRTKSDLHPGWIPPEGQALASAETGEGLEAVRDWLSEACSGEGLGEGEVALVGDRQRQAASQAARHLREAESRLRASQPELAAWSVRQALLALGELVGEVPPDEILAAVFSSFCIGK